MPACVGEMQAPAGPKEAAQAGFPMEAAGRMSQALPKTGGLAQIHPGRSRGLLL